MADPSRQNTVMSILNDSNLSRDQQLQQLQKLGVTNDEFYQITHPPPGMFQRGGMLDNAGNAAAGYVNDIENQLVKGGAGGIPGIVGYPLQAADSLADAAYRAINWAAGVPKERTEAKIAAQNRQIAANPLAPTNWPGMAERATGIGPAQTEGGNIAHAIGTVLPSAMTLGGGTLFSRLAGGSVGAAAGQGTQDALQASGFAQQHPNLSTAATLLAALGGGTLAGMGAGLMQTTPLPGLNRRAQTLVAGMTNNDPEEFARMGPDAYVMESSNPAATTAGVLVGQQGENAKKLLAAVKDSQQGRQGRLLGAVEQNVGPMEDPTITENAMRQGVLDTTAPLFKAAKENAGPIPQEQVDQLLSDTYDKFANKSVSRSGQLRNLEEELRANLAVGNPSMVANKIHDMRQLMDTKLEYGPQSNLLPPENVPAVQEFRGITDRLLKDNIQGMAEADALHHAGMNRADALRYGASVLDTPDSSAVYANNVAKFGYGKPWLQLGMAGDIGNKVKAVTNDLPVLRRIFDAPKNAEIIGETFNEQVPRNMQDLIDAEIARNARDAEIVAGAKTNRSAIAQQIMEAPKFPELHGTPGVAITNILGKAGNALYNKIMMAGSQATRDALTRALLMQGPQGAEMLRSVLAATPFSPHAALANAMLAATLDQSARQALPAPVQ